MKKSIPNYDKFCKFSVDVNTDSNAASDEFLMLEHTMPDEHEYRNGMLAFSLSAKKIKDMVASFKKNAIGRPIYVNYDHSRESTLSAGRFVEVSAKKTESGFGLFGKVEWTPKGKKHIEDKEYNHFSIECEIEGMTAKWEDGELLHDFKIKKSILSGGALTNNPYFTTTNLSLTDNNDNQTEDFNMDAEFAKLNAEFEQLKLNSQGEIASLKLQAESKDAKIAELSKELTELNLNAKNSVIASFVNRLPDLKELRDEVKVKLEKYADRLGTGVEFSEIAEIIISKNDTRIKVVELKGDFKDLSKKEFKDFSPEEIKAAYKAEDAKKWKND
jgi:phage I-like protein